MIETFETEPLDDCYEPQLVLAGDEQEPQTGQTVPSDPALDYERIIGGVTDRIAEAAMDYQRAQESGHTTDYSEEFVQRAADLATRNALHAMMPLLRPMSQDYGLQQVTQGLDEDGQSFIRQFVHEKGIDPALLNEPTIADLVRSKAELHQLKKSGRSIPWTESVGGTPLSGMDAATQRELTGIEKLYRSLNIKFDPSRILGRLK